MRRTIRQKLRLLSLVFAIAVLISLAPPVARGYTPPFTTLKIGLFYNTNALPSANLGNVGGLGSGFDFGYYDSNRNFVPIGAWTNKTAISMVIDRNMVWYPGEGGGAGEYREGTSGTVVLGCFHIMIDAYYETFEQARSAIEAYPDSFVKYDSGRFYAMIGQYTTRAEAETAIEDRELSGCLVNAGTSNTIAVVETGTNEIIFEFDHGDSRYLGVRPRPINDEKPETFFRNYRYCGGFQYARRSGEGITVVNFVNTEDYVKGILPYEMGNSWPLEALKAQACSARNYALASLNKHNAHGFDLCTTEDCQVYRGRGSANERTDRAVNETAGMYITYNGALCTTYYASSNGGASENSENVWSAALPYLRGVIDPYEADVAPRISNYYWTIEYTPQQITQRLQGRGHNCSTIVSMEVTTWTPTGNVLTITMKDDNGKSFSFSKRDGLSSALGVPTQRFTIGNSTYSPDYIYVNDPALAIDSNSQFYAINGDGTIVDVPSGPIYAMTEDGTVEIVSGIGGSGGVSDDTGMTDGVFRITGSGRGHLIGMSQWGAYSMAEYHGKTFVDIIKFYYTGVEVG